jgi:hypothetical protein
MTRKLNGWAAPVMLTAAALAAFAVSIGAQTLGTPERFTATALIGGGRGAAMLDIDISRWSTAAEQSRVISLLTEQGQQDLLDALMDMPKVGYIRTPTSLAWDLRFSQRTPLPEGGEAITLITDRPISFAEQADQSRSLDYPFTVVQLTVNKDGSGTGTLAAAKLLGDANTKSIVVETYGVQPIMLENVARVDRTN